VSTVVWFGADTLTWPEGGGNLWPYLNWALGLRALGCKVIWLEGVERQAPVAEVQSLVGDLKSRLARYGLADSVAVYARAGEPLPPAALEGCVDIEEAREADLLLNLSYDSCQEIMGHFRRTAMVDIDPGLTQVWMNEGVARLPPHDSYFTIGESIGEPGSTVPAGGVRWQHTPPCVALDWWPVSRAEDDAPFTTVSNWGNPEWVTYGDQSYNNNKRSAFVEFLDLPSRTAQPLELALCLEADEQLRLAPYEKEEQLALEQLGWRVVHSYAVASTPWDYQRYVQSSRGEFGCAKPAYVRLQNAWLSDRTLCYLASGKPAVVQHTGPSRFLPDDAGLFRFRDLDQATRCLEAAAADYERQCRLARALAEEHFDARRVARRVLERALD
jgi:hypothetical protein